MVSGFFVFYRPFCEGFLWLQPYHLMYSEDRKGDRDRMLKAVTEKIHSPVEGPVGEAGEVDGLTGQSDAFLVARIAEGHHASYSVLVMRHAGRFLTVAERVLGQRAEAEDAVQEAFVKLWRRADSFDPEAAQFSTWFYRIVVNQCLDRKRKKIPDALPENYDAVDEGCGPDDHLAAGQRAVMMRQALDQLPERQKAAIVLCYYQGLSNKEAADVMDLNVKAVESLLTRGRKSLKNNLGHGLGTTAQEMIDL